MYKPSLIKTNAIYRGPTEYEKYLNMINEIVHDIIFLCGKIDRNESNPASIGHAEAIAANKAFYISGIQGKTMIGVETASTLCNSDMEKFEQFQSISSMSNSESSIKGRISALDSRIKFLLNNL